MGNFSKFFIERPIFASVIAILVTLAGVIASFSLPWSFRACPRLLCASGELRRRRSVSRYSAIASSSFPWILKAKAT